MSRGNFVVFVGKMCPDKDKCLSVNHVSYSEANMGFQSQPQVAIQGTAVFGISGLAVFFSHTGVGLELT